MLWTPFDRLGTVQRILEFYELIEKYRSLLSELSPGELSSSLVEEIGLFQMFREEGTFEAQSRADNVRELLTAIAQYGHNNGQALLQTFLEEAALVTDIDSWDDKSNAVTLMTLHSAKGLEFPVVFVTGLEEGLFPLKDADVDPIQMQEERRLFYVGATRAQDKLFLSWARARRRYGDEQKGVMSRFIQEIDPKYLEVEDSRLPQYPTLRAPQKRSRETRRTENTMVSGGIRPGSLVRHKQFGKGIVLKIEKYDDDLKITVAFDSGETKLIIQSFAKLEIL